MFGSYAKLVNIFAISRCVSDENNILVVNLRRWLLQAVIYVMNFGLTDLCRISLRLFCAPIHNIVHIEHCIDSSFPAPCDEFFAKTTKKKRLFVSFVFFFFHCPLTEQSNLDLLNHTGASKRKSRSSVGTVLKQITATLHQTHWELLTLSFVIKIMWYSGCRVFLSVASEQQSSRVKNGSCKSEPYLVTNERTVHIIMWIVVYMERYCIFACIHTVVEKWMTARWLKNDVSRKWRFQATCKFPSNLNSIGQPIEIQKSRVQ